MQIPVVNRYLVRLWGMLIGKLKQKGEAGGAACVSGGPRRHPRRPAGDALAEMRADNARLRKALEHVESHFISVSQSTCQVPLESIVLVKAALSPQETP